MLTAVDQAKSVQLGWRVALAFSVFEGSLAYKWGYREAADRTVFRWWSFEAAINVFEIEAEVSWGFAFKKWAINVEGVVFGKIVGSAELRGRWEASPSKPKRSLANKWEVSPSLGVRATLGPDWFAAKGEVMSGITFELKFEFGAEPKADCLVEFAGVRADLRGEVKMCGLFMQRSWVWIDKSTLIDSSAPRAGAITTGK